MSEMQKITGKDDYPQEISRHLIPDTSHKTILMSTKSSKVATVLENNNVCRLPSETYQNIENCPSDLKRLVSTHDLTIATESSSITETNSNDEDNFFYANSNEVISDIYGTETTPYVIMTPCLQNDIVPIVQSIEPVKKNNSLFGKECPVHPIDVDIKKMSEEEKLVEFADEIDLKKDKPENESTEEENDSNTEEVATEEKTEEKSSNVQDREFKRKDSFLRFVDPSDQVHEHCSGLMPKKSALKRGKSLPLEDSSVSKKEVQRRASFSTLEIRTYNVTIADNPGGNTSGGAPVGLCWEYDAANIQLHCLETFEELRPSRRNLQQLYLSPYVREWMLVRENGFTVEELKQAAAEADKIRRQRQNTKVMCKYAPIPVQQAFRGLNKKTKRMMKTNNSNNAKIST